MIILILILVYLMGVLFTIGFEAVGKEYLNEDITPSAVLLWPFYMAMVLGAAFGLWFLKLDRSTKSKVEKHE